MVWKLFTVLKLSKYNNLMLFRLNIFFFEKLVYLPFSNKTLIYTYDDNIMLQYWCLNEK